MPVLPGPLAGAEKEEHVTLEDVPDTPALEAWLKARGVDTAEWGANNTKDAGKLWKEIKGEEAGLEVWKLPGDKSLPVRVTHVLRAKVCSAESHERGIFLFNTWQQFGDGRKRTRNALLSEKLSTAEIPLQEHLHEVCQRAIVEEEMQRIIEAAYVIGPGYPAPEYDPGYVCPLNVEQEHFIDHTVEVETSKSFPGLLTMYHLYTVEIICSGLPGVDFNTLEYAPPDKDGHRKLKYIHAWNWLEWPQIQRYLFEGSERKETKKRGSFADERECREWLEQFALDLEWWGESGRRTVKDLFDELEADETHLEVWSRHDGVSLLMRVAHVLQLKVSSTDPRLAGKLLFQTWQQSRDGKVRLINRLPSKKLKNNQGEKIDEAQFAEAAEKAVSAQFTYQTDVHFQMFPHRLPLSQDFSPAEIKPISTAFRDFHCDVEESPSYRGIHTMYHLYCMEMVVEGLEVADFTSVDFSKSSGPSANGWRWVTWTEILDIIHARTQALERKQAAQAKAARAQRQNLEASASALSRLSLAVGRLATEGPGSGRAAEEAKQLILEIQDELGGLTTADDNEDDCQDIGPADWLPPNMVSRMATEQITSEDLLDGLMRRRNSARAASVCSSAR